MSDSTGWVNRESDAHRIARAGGGARIIVGEATERELNIIREMREQYLARRRRRLEAANGSKSPNGSGPAKTTS